MKKLAIISTHAVQYQVPLWRALAARPDLEVRVYFGSDFSVRGYKDAEFGVEVKWDVPLTDGYTHTFLSTDPSINSIERFFSLRTGKLEAELRAFQPDCALICGYVPFFYLEAAWILWRLRIPILLRGEVTEDTVFRSKIKQIVRNSLLKWLYRRFGFFLSIGKNARDHYLSKGVSPSKIGDSPYCIDSEMLQKQIAEFKPQRDATRRELGFDDAQTVFVFSGKLIPIKDPLTFVAALEAMPADVRARIALLVLGDGALRPEFEARCHALLGERAVFVGFRNQSELGKYYAAGDCLVLPSLRETWGLVVNEALQFGIPVIVSEKVGSQRDLVVEGQTGYTFPPQDAARLTERLVQMVDLLHTNRATVTQACQRQAQKYSMSQAAEGIYAAVQTVSGSAKR